MSERLYFLVQSLNKTEKSQFSRQYGNKDSLYLDIYKLYQSAKQYNKVKFEAKLKKKWSGKNIRQSKIYLESIILKALSDSLERSKINAELKRLNELAEVQISKGFSLEYIKTYEKIYNLTKDAAMDLEHMDVSIRLIFSLNAFSSKELIEKKEQIFNSFDEKINDLNSYLISKKYYFKSLFRANKSLKLLPNETVADILKEIVIIDLALSKSESTRANYFFLESKFIYYSIIEDFKNCYNTCNNQLTIFENNEGFKNHQIAQYAQKNVHVLMLLDLSKQKKETAIAIKAGMDKLKSKTFTFQIIKKVVTLLTFKFTLSYQNVEQQQLELKQFEIDFEELFKKLPVDLKLYLYVQFAYLNFILNDFEKSLDWVIRFENEDKNHVRQDLQTKIKLIGILNHYHLENNIALPYFIKQTYRLLLNKVEIDSFEKWLLKSIRKLNREGFSINLAKTLLKEYEDKKTEEEYSFVNVFDYSYWLKSLIEKKSYLEILEKD